MQSKIEQMIPSKISQPPDLLLRRTIGVHSGLASLLQCLCSTAVSVAENSRVFGLRCADREGLPFVFDQHQRNRVGHWAPSLPRRNFIASGSDRNQRSLTPRGARVCTGSSRAEVVLLP
jgi:hypothetical protein